MEFTEPLRFPVVIGFSNDVIPAIKSGSKLFIKKHLRENKYLFKCGATPNMKIHFIIDRTGSFRRVRSLELRRVWGKPIAWLLDLVLDEVELEPGTQLSNAELLRELDGLPGKGWRNRNRFRRFIKKQPADSIFDSIQFKAYWLQAESELSEEEWCEELPDKECREGTF